MSAKGVDEEARASTQLDDAGGGGGGDAVWGGDMTCGHGMSVSKAKQNKNKKNKKKELTRWHGQTRAVASVDKPGRGEGGS